MSNFDELDEMTGSMSDWVSKKQGATSLTRITPSSPKKVKTFELTTKITHNRVDIHSIQHFNKFIQG